MGGASDFLLTHGMILNRQRPPVYGIAVNSEYTLICKDEADCCIKVQFGEPRYLLRFLTLVNGEGLL